jgi:hypothetical protein
VRPTTVVDISHAGSEFDVYIGRKSPRAKDKRCHTESPFANPFRVGVDGERGECIDKFRVYIEDQLADEVEGPRLRRLLGLLQGKRLGCWCKGKRGKGACHGDVLAELADKIKVGAM